MLCFREMAACNDAPWGCYYGVRKLNRYPALYVDPFRPGTQSWAHAVPYREDRGCDRKTFAIWTLLPPWHARN